MFRDMAIDVSSDISVLHTVLAQEGLVESPFDKQRANSPSGGARVSKKGTTMTDVKTETPTVE